MLFSILSGHFGFDRANTADMEKMQSIAKMMWSGDKIIEFTQEEIVYHAPRLVVKNPEDIVVPEGTESVFDFEDAGWIDDKYYVTPQHMMENKLTGKWKSHVVDAILRKHGFSAEDIQNMDFNKVLDRPMSTGESDKADREGGGQTAVPNQILIHEVSKWYDADNDGREERHILEFCDDYLEEDLRFIGYPCDMAMWSYVKLPYEITDTDHYSPRGTVEIENPLADALNEQHNMKLNRQALSTTPIMAYAPGRVNPANLKFKPNNPIPVAFPVNQSFASVMMPDVSASFMMEETLLKGWDEEMMASQDFGIQTPTNMSGSQKARTATEMTQVAQYRAGVRELDIKIWLFGWQEVFKRVWALWMQYGPEKYSYIGENGKTVLVAKKGYAGDFDIIPNGKFGAADSVFETQKVFRRFEMFRGDPLINQQELYREFLNKDDPRLVKRLINQNPQMPPQKIMDMVASQAEAKPTGASNSPGMPPQIQQQGLIGREQMRGNPI
jgi:hypothetical protein